MSEEPKIESSAEGPKSEQQDPFADFTKNLNARLSGKEIDLDTYTFYKQTIDSLRSADDPKKELNALLSGKKIKLEDFKRLREIADEIVKGKEPATGTGGEAEKAPLTRDEIIQQMSDAMTRRDKAEVDRLSTLLKSMEPASATTPEPPTQPGGAATGETPQGREAEKPLNVPERFAKEFGIAAKELEEIPGYGELTDGQKEMVFENLRQVTLGRIQEEAGKEYRKNTAEVKVLRRFWQVASKKFQIAKLERGKIENFQFGGMEVHGKILEKLVAGAKEGPEATRKDDGSVEIQFFGDTNFKKLAGRGATEGEKTVIQEFDKSVSAFSKIPYEWSLQNATRRQRHKFENAKLQYELNRGYLLTELRKVTDEPRAMREAIALDGKIEMTQFLTTHPKVERQLQKIESKWVWARAIRNTLAERLGYFAFGTVSRTLAVGALGAIGAPVSLIGAPLAAMGVGGFIAHRRARETLKEEARMSRKGSGKLFEARTGEKQVRPSRDYMDAPLLKNRLGSLLEKISSGTGKTEIHKKHLDRLIQLAEAKLKDGLVNFGRGPEGIENQFQLIRELGKAKGEFAVLSMTRQEHERLESALMGRKEKIAKHERAYVRKEVLKGVAIAGGLAFAGHLAMEWYRGDLFSGKEQGLRVAAPDEEAEIGRAIKKATGADVHGITAPPETPIAPPDEEAAIRHAIEESTGAEVKGAVEFTPEQLRESVRTGDSVWKTTERKLDGLFGNKFTELDPARKTFVIDAIKDEIAGQMKEQGLNPDRLKIGQELDYSGILDNKEKMDSFFARANDLDASVRESIVKNNKMIADWMQEHPGERLTSERVEEIIHPKPTRAEIPTDYTHDTGPTREESFYNGVSLAEAEAYGSRESAFFAKLAGLSEHEYKTIRTIKIRDILEQIPSEKEARIIWEGQIPGRTINLPYFEQYDKSEFEGHIRLAGILRHYIQGHPHEAILSGMTVDDFFKVAAPEEGPIFRGATPPDFLEPEEFAQMEPQRTVAPIEQTSGKFATEPYSAEYTPPDQRVGAVLIEGKDIVAYGTAEEAFVAKTRLGMIPREWESIKSLETRELLNQTPEGATKMNPAELRQWHETQKPKLPGASSFDSFRKQALLADAIRESLKTKSDQEYLKSLPVRELVRNFVLEETGKGGTAGEVAEKTAGFDHTIQAP